MAFNLSSVYDQGMKNTWGALDRINRISEEQRMRFLSKKFFEEGVKSEADIREFGQKYDVTDREAGIFLDMLEKFQAVKTAEGERGRLATLRGREDTLFNQGQQDRERSLMDAQSNREWMAKERAQKEGIFPLQKRLLESQIEATRNKKRGLTQSDLKFSDKQNDERKQYFVGEAGQLGVKLYNDGQSITGEVTEKNRQQLDFLAGKMGIKVFYAPAEKRDKKGLFTGDEVVYPITNVVVQPNQETPSGTEGRPDQQGLMDEIAKRVKDKRLMQAHETQQQEEPKGELFRSQQWEKQNQQEGYDELFLQGDIIWGKKNGQTVRVMVKPSETIYNGRYPNPEYERWQGLLRKIKANEPN